MSSRKFVSELTPETTLRHALVATGMFAYLVGVATILTAAVTHPLQLLAAATWTVWVILRCGVVTATQWRYRRIRISADGQALLLDQSQCWQPATLHKDSIVLPAVAWLRLSRPGARPYYELLRGDARESEQWRRLQVIWRHMGSGS